MDPKTKAAIDMMNVNDVLSAKVISMVVLGLCSFILGLAPMKLSKYVNMKNVDGDKNLLISLLMCFGGGVLLFTTFIHIQPEVREGFAILELQNKLPEMWGNLPISEIVLCAGLLAVYFIEEVAHKLLRNRVSNEVLHRSLSMRCSKKDSQIAIPRVTLNKFEDGNISCITTSNKQLLNSQSTINIETSSSGHQHHHFHLKKSFSGALAVLALSFHAVFEGLAVGLETSEEKVWYLFLAIATHKFVIAFCVGIELVTSETKTSLTILYIGIFSIVTPLGIGVGLLLTEGTNEVNLISLILQGMAAGTLLYVVFFEVLSRERSNDHCGIYQLISIILGFLLMASLQIITGHDHGSHHHNHPQPEHHHHEDIMMNLT